MLRLKEGRQQAIDLQKSGPSQLHAPISPLQVSLVGKQPEPFRKLIQDIGFKLALEVARLQPAGFELEDHLPNEKLARLHWQGTTQGQLASVEHADVFFPAIDILH